MDEVSLRSLFHGALDEVAPPKPWLAGEVRDELRRYRSTARMRRRQRFWTPALRRAIAAALVLIVAGTAAAATVAIFVHRHQVPVIPMPGGPVTKTCGVDNGTIRMLDEKFGWKGTQRTTDGGKTWHDVSPPPLPGALYKGGGATCAFDPNSAWVVIGMGSDLYQPTAVTIEYTHDAGVTWFRGATIPVPWTVSWRISFSVLLDFVDLKHGWLFMEYATNPLQRQIYATADGGATWVRVSTKPDLGLGLLGYDCSLSGLMFDTLQRGWLTWNCSSGFGDVPGTGTNVIAVTNDGGKTWAQVLLNGLPTGNDWICGVTSPVFTREDGLLEVQCGGIGHPGNDQLFSTRDGGTTWSYHPLATFKEVDILDGTTAFYFGQPDPKGPNTLYRTVDGGAKWSTVATGLFPGKTLSGLTFIDAQVGFVGVADSPTSWWTYDGGKTWALPPPYHSVGSTVCDVYHDPATHPQPQSVKMMSPTVGWAPGTRRTTDGGLHWTNVAPPAPRNRAQGYAEYFLDSVHAWVVDTVGSKTACADRFNVFRTDDGGASWKQVSSTVVKSLPADITLSGDWTVHVQFVDTRHGWLQVSLPRGGFGDATQNLNSADVHLAAVQNGNVTQPLYSTSDGGTTWSLVTQQSTWTSGDCSGGGFPMFTSPTTGWISATCTGATASSANLLVTRDGGRTWGDVELLKNACDTSANPGGCGSPPLPTFFDSENGWWTDDSHLLTTTDGGMTWIAGSLPHGRTYTCQYYGASAQFVGRIHDAPPPGPQVCQSLIVDAVSFVSPTEGFAVATEMVGAGIPTTLLVEHTSDAGKTWTVVHRQGITIQSDQGEFFQFVDSNDGFWWFGLVVMHTTDGGHTWTGAATNYS